MRDERSDPMCYRCGRGNLGNQNAKIISFKTYIQIIHHFELFYVFYSTLAKIFDLIHCNDLEIYINTGQLKTVVFCISFVVFFPQERQIIHQNQNAHHKYVSHHRSRQFIIQVETTITQWLCFHFTCFQSGFKSRLRRS